MKHTELQRALREAGFDPGRIDGVLGHKSEAAIKAFQRAHGLVVDGDAGPKTIDALTHLGGAPKPSQALRPHKEPFEHKAPRYMTRMMADLPALDLASCAAIFGNLGHESAGLNPLAIGPSGDTGWAQWMGARRRGLKTYCQAHGLDWRTDDAQYAYVIHELKGGYQDAIREVTRPGSLMSKVQRFERKYEVAAPNSKHYPSRHRFATIALAAYHAVQSK